MQVDGEPWLQPEACVLVRPMLHQVNILILNVKRSLVEGINYSGNRGENRDFLRGRGK